jgi:hypothetical protein
MTTTIQPVYQLSPEWEGPVVLVALDLIMANVTCEGRILAGPNQREAIRESYTPWSGLEYQSWDGLLSDLRRNGIRFPVMWDPRALQLGNGHHRVVAAYDLGWTHIPTVPWDVEANWDVMADNAWYASGGE